MDIVSTAKLLGTIGIHYPAFKQHIVNKAGDIDRHVVEEWNRTIGFLSYDEAIQKLDEYLKLEDGNRFAPDVKWFLRKKETPKNEWRSEHRYDRLDGHGRLTDAEGRLYAFPNRPDALYHYNGEGRIVDSKGFLVGRN